MAPVVHHGLVLSFLSLSCLASSSSSRPTFSLLHTRPGFLLPTTPSTFLLPSLLPRTRLWSTSTPDDDSSAARLGNRRRRRRKVTSDQPSVLPTSSSQAIEEEEEDDDDDDDDESDTESEAVPGVVDQKELEQRLLKDIARFKAMEVASGKGEDKPTVLDTASDIFSTVLVVDFFVVMAFLTWFGAGVATKTLTKDAALLDAFYNLWNPVIQPALGILMAGTMAGGGVSFLKKKFGGGEGA